MGDFEHIARHLILDYPEYTCELDEYRSGEHKIFVAHIVFTKFTPTVFKRFLREWRTFRTVVKMPIFAHNGDGEMETWKHFVTSIGFVDTGDTLTFANGTVRPLFIHLANG